MHRSVSLVGGLLAGAVVAAAGWITLVPAVGATLEIHGYDYRIGTPDSPEADANIAAAIKLRAQQLLREEVYLRADDEVLVGRAADWGYSVDIAAAIETARRGLRDVHVGPSEHVGVWALRRFSSAPEVYSVELGIEFDPKRAEARLNHLATLLEREPVDARLLISEHKIVPSEEGRALSVGATVVRLEAADLSEDTVMDAVVERVRPRVTEEDLAPVDVTRVLAQFETSFRGKAGARAVNIRTAGRYLNGAIVLPGEVLSFNQQVGRRVHGRGFVDAPVILNDELELDVGGGVCQVATTLHGAAVYGNMDIVRRRSHSRPSGYAPLGLDATVIDGKVDLQIRNPFDEPILVYVSFPSDYVIRVELLGRDPDAKVEHGYTVTHREPFVRRVWRKDDAPLGGFEQKQKGSEGMDVLSVLRIKHKDGKLERRSYRSKYYPVPEVFWVGEGASPGALPEMPQGAVALVVDGEEVEGAVQGPDEEDTPTMYEADGSNMEPREPADTN